MLSRKQLYRVTVSVDPAWTISVKSQAPATKTGQAWLTYVVKESLRKLSGNEEVLLVMNDPSNTDVWSALIRKEFGPGVYANTPFNVLKSVIVEEPADVLQKLAPVPNSIDLGLTSEELDVIRYILVNDVNPKHLFGLARSCMPDYPVVASLLDAKGRVVSLRRQKEALDDQANETRARLKLVSLRLGKDVSAMWNTLGGNINAIGKWKPPPRKTEPPKPVTAAALQLAHATRRPELSGVINPDKLKDRLKEIGASVKEGDPRGKEAQEALIRANKALERRQWVEWYRRIRQIESQDRTEQGCLTRPF